MKPNLKTTNKTKELLKLAKEYAKEISVYKGIIGITIGGGATRGHADEFSDLDLSVYLDSKTYSAWQKKSPVPKGDHYWKGHLAEIELLDYEKEKKRDWTLGERWEKKSHLIFFDTNSKIKKLLKKKIVWKKGEKKQVSNFSADIASWFITELPNIWIKRGDIAQAHYVSTTAIDWILDYIFVKNNYFIPFGKWKIHYVFLMKKKPRNFNKNIKEAMKIKNFNKTDVLRRQRILIKILKQLKIYDK